MGRTRTHATPADRFRAHRERVRRWAQIGRAVERGELALSPPEEPRVRIRTLNQGLWGRQTATSEGEVRFDELGVAEVTRAQEGLLLSVPGFERA